MTWKTLGDLHDLREFDDSDVTKRCSHCGFRREWYDHPEWARQGAVFALDGKTYRIVCQGTTNRLHYPHVSAYVTVEELDSEKWSGLPEAPCTKRDILVALKDLNRLPQIEAKHLVRAIRVVA